MRQLIPTLMAGLLVACAGDSTNPPEPAANQLRVVNGPATCNACSVVELTVAGPGLDKVSDASLTHHATQASVATSVEIRHFIGDSGLVLQIKVTFTEAVPAGDYDLLLQALGTSGQGGTLKIPIAVKVTSPSPGPGTPPPPPPPPPGPTGVVRVAATTTGALPAAPYQVTVDPCDPAYSCGGQFVPPGGTVSIAFSPGSYTIGLANVPVACTVAAPRSVVVTVIAGQTVDVAFSVTCPPPPPGGTLRVTASVTGSTTDLDFLVAAGTCDYYSYTCETRQLHAGQSVEFSLAPGSYALELLNIAGNCTAAAPNPRTVTVTANATTDVAFSVSCVAAGRVRVFAPTAGSDPDDGYLASLGTCGGSGYCSELWLGAGAVVEFTVVPGSYPLRLSDISPNCTVSGSNPVTVTVSADVTTDVVFLVSCTPLPPPPPPPAPGTVRVTAPTSGNNRDTDYFSVNLSACDYYYGCTQQPLPATGHVDYMLVPGNYTFTLVGIAANCTVTVPTPATVTVVSNMVTALVFPVSCQ